MKSSYLNALNYGDVISTLTFLQNPSKIVEFGILDGFSLQTFAISASSQCKIEAYDIFDEFNGNHATLDISIKFSSYTNVSIKYGDFYKFWNNYEDESIDILHIDIANNGDVYEYTFDHWMNKVKYGGLIIFEGGSHERDEIEWMNKYNKPKICPIIQKYSTEYEIKTIGTIPSITIVKKCAKK